MTSSSSSTSSSPRSRSRSRPSSTDSDAYTAIAKVVNKFSHVYGALGVCYILFVCFSIGDIVETNNESPEKIWKPVVFFLGYILIAFLYFSIWYNIH